MKKWLNYEFESSTVQTPEFKTFARSFKTALNKQLKEKSKLAVIVSYNIGHFYVSGFIREYPDTDKYVYFSISDVRYSKNDWYKHILYRTAKDTKDFTGGNNNYTSFDNFAENVVKLFNTMSKDSTIKLT